MTKILPRDVAYRKQNGQGTRLYARMSDLALAIQQFNAAVRTATTNPRCPYTMIWIAGHEADYCWIKP